MEETISIAASRFDYFKTASLRRVSALDLRISHGAWFLKIVQEKQYRNAILHFSILSNMEV
ncbi:hypothetical protein EXS66_00335 [Candidatus Saccharibacteria bacterium]|nr:hypothetical protein [Candidatus Saccharibacteria bacterium]